MASLSPKQNKAIKGIIIILSTKKYTVLYVYALVFDQNLEKMKKKIKINLKLGFHNLTFLKKNPPVQFESAVLINVANLDTLCKIVIVRSE